MDLILSSGYLAFARHLGFLEAVKARDVVVDAVVGTSSGALVGALWLAGVPLHQVAELFSERRPLGWFALSRLPWRGALVPKGARQVLSRYLPPTFEELELPFAVGVTDRHGQHHLIHRGQLVPAVLASFAIPRLFVAQRVGEQDFWDGGVTDRVGVAQWRKWRPGKRAIVHRVQRTRGTEIQFSGPDLTLVETPSANASLWSLKDFYSQKEAARTLTLARLNHGFEQQVVASSDVAS